MVDSNNNNGVIVIVMVGLVGKFRGKRTSQENKLMSSELA